MSVDLEDHFCNLPYEEWSKYENRIVKNTKIILKLFEKHNVKATFFTVGHIAEKNPELIKEVVLQGHEIASHSQYHIDLRKMSPDSFEEDLKKSIKTLESISGEKIHGFRAPYYSINKQNFWVFDILKKYVKYDSSVFPVKTTLYGLPKAPRHAYKMSKSNPLLEDKNEKLLELPPATLKIPIIGNFPIAGGFYLRMVPLSFIKLGIKRINKQNKNAMIYVHPHDIDETRPKIRDVNPRAYWGIKKSLKKFEHLLNEFDFDSVKNIYFN